MLQYYFRAVISGSLIASASFAGGEMSGVCLGWAAAFGLVWTVSRNERCVRALFVAGMVTHLVGFYWLPETLSTFGGFPFVVSCFLFFMFALVSSLQFALVGVLFHRLQGCALVRNLRCAFAVSWFAAEALFPRLFPWAFSHFQLSWSSFAALARYAGVFPLSALIFWTATILFEFVTQRGAQRVKLPLCVLALVMIPLLLLGWRDVLRVEEEMRSGEKLRVGLVQGNLDAREKRNIRLLEANLERYRELSKEVQREGAEVLFWPESVVNRWLPEEVTELSETEYEVFREAAVPLFYGGLALRHRSSEFLTDDGVGKEKRDRRAIRYFNAVFLRDPEGRIAARYYKRILMPFGEFMPFADTFPILREVSEGVGDFDRGDQPLTARLLVGRGERRRLVGVGMLICYEDLVPPLSREAVRGGAQVLVNFTNDAWYGRTAAPAQHHLLAAWRAVETGRYLLRVTNTGLTGIVNPRGETERSLPIFEAGTIVHEIALFSRFTPYVMVGDWPVLSLAVFVVLAALSLRSPGSATTWRR